MPFRFVHAADIHLDSPLSSLALRDPELAVLVGTATRSAFTAIIDLCLDEKVDALLLAGDLYDGSQTSMKTAIFLATSLQRLHEAGIATYLIRGNHDAESRITRELVLPPSVKIFTGRAEAVPHPRAPNETPVILHGLSFAQTTAPESLLPRYRPPTPGAINVGLMHTSLDGSLGHDPYAPCAAADLDAHGYDYWALGHIHKRSERTGHSCIVMPGIPQGRDINESGPKSATLVTIADDGTLHIEARPTALAQFERVQVDLTGLDDWRAIPPALAAALAAARSGTRAEHLIARLTLTGATPLAWRLRSQPEAVQAQALAAANSIGKTWIERSHTTATPLSDPATAGHHLAELRRLIDTDILPDPAFQAALAILVEQLPPECRSLLGDDEATARARLAAIACDGADDVLARLHAPEPV